MLSQSYYFLPSCQTQVFSSMCHANVPPSLDLADDMAGCFFNLIFNSSQISMTTPNSRKKILTDMVEFFYCIYGKFNKTFQNSRQNVSENELGSLFVANEGEAFSYPASILGYAKCLSYFALFQIVYAGVLHNYTKIMLLGFRIFKNVPSVLESSNPLEKCSLRAWKNLFMP